MLTTSLTADESAYELGQPIQLTFTETNVGTTPLQVLEGPSSFDVKQNGSEVWNSLFPDRFPDAWAPQSYTWVTLQPGQSFTQTATWNGVPDQLPSGDLSGTFTVTNELDPRAGSTTLQLVAPPTNSLSSSITTDQLVYDFDQPVQLTFTETNTGNQPVVVLTGPNAFELTSVGTVVWFSTNSNDLPSNTRWETLQPGQSYTQTLTWNGFDGYSITSPEGTGTFTVSNLLDPKGSTATIQVLNAPYPGQPNSPPLDPPPPGSNPPQPILTSPPPIAVTLTTAPTYKLGQQIPLSLVLRNVTAKKVAIKQTKGLETVTVRDGTTLVYDGVLRARARPRKLLKAGQPLKLTTVWPGHANQASLSKLTPGTYTITVDDDGYAASSTVQLVSRRR